MIYGFFLSLLVNILSVVGFLLLYKGKAKLITTKDSPKLLGTNLKEAELRLKEINAETELVTLELDNLRFDLETEKEKLLASIGPKGKVIKELDKKIKERQKELDNLGTRMTSKDIDENTAGFISDAKDVIDHLLGRVGLTEMGNACEAFKSDPRNLRALNWLLAEGYIYSFYASGKLWYSLNPKEVKKPIQDFYKLVKTGTIPFP